MYDRKKFSERLKELRNSTGKTQKEFAKSIGSTPATISAYENGTKNPSLDIVSSIAQEYKVSLDWLCGLEDIEKKLEIKTYKDIYRFLLTLQKEHKELFVLRTVDGELYGKLPAIAFDNRDMTSFFNDWKKMKSLLDEEAIDEEVFELWVEKTLRKSEIPIDESKKIDDVPF